MTKKKNINMVIIILVLSLTISATISASAQWTTSVSKDEMDETETWYATSSYTSPTEKMSFPYGNIKAWLGIGYNGKQEWVYIGFNDSPNLTDTSIKDGYDLISTRIKWNDEVENIVLTQKWGSKFIHFRDDKAIVSKINQSDTVLLELNWYGEGKVYFRFSLVGSSDAINKIHSAFED